MKATKLAIALAVLQIVTGTSAGAADRDTAPQRRPEDSRKQKAQLLPPKEAAEMKDSDIAPDQYQAKGLDAGQFLILPKFDVERKWVDNVYATNYDGVSDYITSYSPEIQVRSRMDRHSVGALARAQRRVYDRYDRESVTNAFANLNGTYEFDERDSLNGAVSYTHDHEDRGSPDATGGLRPTEFHYLTLNASGVKAFGRFTATLGQDVIRRDWEDTRTSTGITPSRLRNRWEYETKTRGSYELFPSYSAIAEVAVNERRYINKPDQAGFNRDSDGYRVGTGMALDVAQLVRGDFQVGYFSQDYKDRRLQDPSGLYLKAMFNWTPTRLTTVIPSLERSVEETTATGVTALVRTAANVTVRHELQRNVILGMTAGYSKDEQKGGGLTANTWESAFRVNYLLNDTFYTGGEVGYRHKLTNIDGSGFNQTAIMLRFGLQY